MNHELSIKIFYSLLRCGLWGRPDNEMVETASAIGWDEVFRLAEEQSVVGLVAAGIEELRAKNSDLRVPQEWALQVIGQTLQLEQRNKAMNEFVASLVRKLRAAGIYALLVKGQGIAQCYEKPLWRSCGDVDLFLSDDNYEKAKGFLTPFASSVETEYVREKHLGMTINGWVVELHGRLYSGLSSRIERELDAVYHDTFYGGSVRSWDNNGVLIYQLKTENDAFYVFTHILQHFYKEGVGLRQICDWCRLLWTFRDTLDVRVLESRLRKAGLMSEWRAFGTFAVEYLGMSVEAMPFYSGSKKWEQKAKRINDFILNVGNMGHNRDADYMQYPFMVRKFFSAGRRLSDLIKHVRIFPLDSLRFSSSIMKNGVVSALRGEG